MFLLVSYVLWQSEPKLSTYLINVNFDDITKKIGSFYD